MASTQITHERNYDPTTMPEYRQGYNAFMDGRRRSCCPYKSGHGIKTWNARRHAWMVGHLDAEFENKHPPAIASTI